MVIKFSNKTETLAKPHSTKAICKLGCIAGIQRVDACNYPGAESQPPELA